MTDTVAEAASDGDRRAQAIEQLAMAVNVMSERMSLEGRRGGEGFDGERRYWRTLGYPRDVEISFGKYLAKYKRDPIAGRIVDAPAHTTWRRGVQIVELDDDDNPVDPDGQTDFERAAHDLMRRVSAVEKWERVDQVAGIGQYAVYVIGSTKAGGDQLAEPIHDDGISGPDDIAFLTVVHQGHAKIREYVDDPTDPRNGLPRTYDVTFREGKSSSDTVKHEVHHSRVVHVAEDPLEDDLHGRPRLQRAYNALEDVAKIRGGSAEMFWSNVGGLLWGKVPPGTDIETEDKTPDEVLESIADALLAGMHEQRRVHFTQGLESLEYLGAGTPDPSGIFKVLRSILAADGIPESVLFGSERGDVAKSHDIREWLGRIAERQTRFAGPQIVRPFFDLMIELGALDEPAGGYRPEWPSLFESDEVEEAEVTERRASAAKSIADAIVAGGDPAIEVLRTLIPELEGALSDPTDVEGLANYLDEEDAASLADVEAWLADRRGDRDGDRRPVTA